MLKNAAEEFGPFSKEMDEKLRQVGYGGRIFTAVACDDLTQIKYILRIKSS